MDKGASSHYFSATFHGSVEKAKKAADEAAVKWRHALQQDAAVWVLHDTAPAPAGAKEGSIYSLTRARKMENSVEAEAARLAASMNVGEADAARRQNRTWQRGANGGGIQKPERRDSKKAERKPGTAAAKQGARRPPRVRR